MSVDKTNESKKGKLFKQIMKFAVVGGLSFVIDFVVYTIVIKVIGNRLPGTDVIIAGTAGFSISLIFNYLASMAFVFERKENASRKTEFVIFLVLSIIGLLLNNLLLWFYSSLLCANGNIFYNIHDAIYNGLTGIGIGFFSSTEELIKIFAKVFATALVMVYNFISRKMTLEKKD